MTLFQAILQSILASFSQFVPVGEGVHQKLLQWGLQWPGPSLGIESGILLGCTLATFFTHWNDWASMTSSLLQVILFRKKPKTLDERLPLLIGLATVITLLLEKLFQTQIPETLLEPRASGLLLLAGAALIWGSIQFSRKKKALYDWNWIDSAIAGAFQTLAILPGAGRILGVLVASQLRHHQETSAVRFAALLAFPWFLSRLVPHFNEMTWGASTCDLDGTSWLFFSACTVVSLITSWVTMQGFARQSRIEGWSGWIKYRTIVGAALFAWSFFAN